MKKLVLAGAIALTGLMNAQESGFKGKTFVLGTVNYTNQSVEDVDGSSSTYTVLPGVGHFVAPTVAVGAFIGVKGSVTKVDSDNKTNQNVVAFVPMARKYWSLGSKLYMFGQVAVPMAWGTQSATVAGVKTDGADVSSYGVQIAPGLDYFLTSNWTVEATIGGFGYNSTKVEGMKAKNDFNFGVDLSNINLGVKYVF